MFTSRAEYRLLLRQDNADRRLTPLGRELGCITEERSRSLDEHEAAITKAESFISSTRHEGKLLEEWLRRPEIGWTDLCGISPELAALETPKRAAQQVEVETKYAGYIRRQAATVEKLSQTESIAIPPTFDFRAVPNLRFEAKEKLLRVQPANVGQAGRISGITPADLAVLMLYLREPTSA